MAGITAHATIITITAAITMSIARAMTGHAMTARGAGITAGMTETAMTGAGARVGGMMVGGIGASMHPMVAAEAA